jgi:hypothetical protein
MSGNIDELDKNELDNPDELNNKEEIEINENKKIKLCGKKSKFSTKLYERYDIPARNKIKEVLGEYIYDNPDIYGEDMILNIENCKYKYLELQVCASWVTDKYPHPKPYIYERKIKFSDKSLFLIFNKKMTQGLIFSRTAIVNKPKRIKKYSREFIYEIEWNKILPVYMDNFTPETILLY